jgi:hypothetical protein
VAVPHAAPGSVAASGPIGGTEQQDIHVVRRGPSAGSDPLLPYDSFASPGLMEATKSHVPLLARVLDVRTLRDGGRVAVNTAGSRIFRLDHVSKGPGCR